MNSMSRISIISGETRSPLAGFYRASLGGLEPLYRGLIAVRNTTFDKGLRHPAQLGRTTISVGNLTTGGTGKTPMVTHLVNCLRAFGATPAVLLRGYKGRADNHELNCVPPPPRYRSDEQQEYEQAFGGSVPVAADPDRRRSARFILHHHPKVSVFVLDDGFQHRQVHRDLDLVLIDATCPFGFGRLLPRGLLREPASALRRAAAVIVTRSDQIDASRLINLDNQIERLGGRRPIAHTCHHWEDLLDAAGNPARLDELAEKRVVAVCAIGNPKSFLTTLSRHVGAVLHSEILPDHCPYSKGQIENLMDQACLRGADALVLTEKDWVKWREQLAGNILPLPVLRPRLSIRLLDGADALDQLLQSTSGRSDPASSPHPHCLSQLEANHLGTQRRNTRPK